jgi:tungstate transport system ATP-binding protein
MQTVIKVEKLKKSYDNKTVLDIPLLSFEKNKIYAVVGPNGSGKTTLINILNLLDKPDEGIILFSGKDIKQYSKQDILRIRRRMTLVHQKPFLFQTSVFNNVAYGLKLRGIATESYRTKIMNALAIVGLTDFSKRNAHQLSGGEAQRTVIARALVLEPEILFLDEPTANIDLRHIDVIERIIKKINREMKTTVIFTTHDLSQAYRLADEIISLLDGRIVPHVPENVFRGKIIHENDRQWIELTDNIQFSIVTKKKGMAYIYIDPKDIIISCKQFSSSARNSFYGKVIKISEQNKLIRLTIDIGVQLISIITKESFQDMKINIGSNACLTFKASSVKCY